MSETFTPLDIEMMARALQLAGQGIYTAHPNPRVGCVVVKEGEIIGQGYHAQAGEPHAEIIALEDAGKDAEGSTVYVSLEPCCHYGRTSPCGDALIKAGICELIAAMEDPNPKVAGGGFDKLKDAGIKVRVGLLETRAKKLNEGFIFRMQHGRPFVRLKLASSLDGATAMLDGESKWITGEAARKDVQKLRASSGAIMTGVGTVLADDPSLTVRNIGLELYSNQPLRVVLDSRLRMRPESKMLTLEGRTIVFCTDDANRQALEAAGAVIIKVPSSESQTSLNGVLQELAVLEINEVLIEAGPSITGNFISAGLADELIFYQAPYLMGSHTRRMLESTDWTNMSDRRSLKIIDLRKVGDDIRIVARPIS